MSESAYQADKKDPGPFILILIDVTKEHRGLLLEKTIGATISNGGPLFLFLFFLFSGAR